MYLILLLSISFCQNFLYKSDDWYTISNPGSINSITSSHNQIYFCSENGIYIYDISTSSLVSDEKYLTDFDASKPILIHYDEYTDYIWYLNEKSLNYRPRISSFWRQIYFHELNISSYRMINNIGSNHENLFLDIGHSILMLDSISGSLELEDDNFDYNSINWSSSLKSNLHETIDLSNYFSFDGYNIISNDRIEYNGKIIYINCIYKDKYHDYWLGTNTGEIFYCNSKMNSIEKLHSIPLISDIQVAYIDEYEQWWFSTNDDIYINQNIVSSYPIFISHWDELDNIWTNYTKSEYSNIESRDITCIKRVDNWLYIGTKKGLLIFNIYENEWILFDQNNGIKSNYIYDINFVNNNIYIATSKGISVLTTLGNIIINLDIFDIFNGASIFKLNLIDDKILISSEIGIYEYDYKKNIIDYKVNEKYLSAFYDENNNIIAARRNKLYLLSHKKKLLVNLDKIKNICLCNDHIWINNLNKAIILNLEDENIFEYNYEDGIIGSIINDIGCDDNWVWFATNKGLSIYNWSKYHFNEK